MTAPSQPIPDTATERPPTLVRRENARRSRPRAAAAFGFLAITFAAGVVVQVFLAGLGVFGAHGATLDHASSLDAHRAFGDVLGVVAIVLFVWSLPGMPRRLVATTLAIAVLTEVAQHGLAQAGLRHSWAGGLHAADGALILLLGVYVTVTARRAQREARR